MGRAPCCDKSKVKRGPWSPEEDTKLKEYIEKFGTGGNWIALPQKVGLKRCGKSCRLRWLNYLRPNIKHGDFSEDEDRIICTLFATIGSRWSIIAAQLPSRTDNDIKNYWNTKLKKKLLGLPASQRKSKQQQQQHQQHNCTDYNIPTLSGFEALHMNPQVFNIDNGMNNYDYLVMKEEQKNSNFLMFGNDDGIDHGFENNSDYISYAGLIEGSQNINMGLFGSGSSSNDQEASLEMYGYGEIHDPSSTNISFETRERVVYSYDYNNMH